MSDENESTEPQAGTISSHLGKVEDPENRGSAGGPNSGGGVVSGGGPVANDDTSGSKQGASAAQEGPKEAIKPEASGEGSGESSHEKSMAADPSHQEGIRKGEEMATDKEPGRYDSGTSGAGRPAGGSTGRDSTSINPSDPIDPEQPITPANK